MTLLLDRLQKAVADRYAVQIELGRGGMAVVYLAEDLRNHRTVAIKILEPALATEIGTSRFLREIEIAARLVHPHILPLFDSGEADGLLFYVMPYVEGESLRARLNREGALALPEALRIARQVASALQFAHQQGFVHRDIKPGNILLQGDTAFVADFGIALAMREVESERLTQSGLSLGTPAYMSPEQATGDRHIDQRCDIYSLGSVLYEMLTGVPPFEGSSVRAVIARIMTESPTRPSVIRPTIPESVEKAVLQAMAKTPADRFRTAEEFIQALDAARETSRSSRRPLIVAGLAGLALVMGSAAWLLAGHRTPNPPTGDDTANRVTSIGVLPFVNRGDSTTEYLSEGLADDLITQLSEVPGLRVAARTSSFSFKGKSESLHAIAAKLNVAAVLEGSVLRGGDSIRVTIRLIDAGSEAQIWSGTFTGIPSEIAGLENLLLDSTLAAMRQRFPGHRIAGNGNAYDLYLKGRYHYEKYDTDEVRKALQYFSDAIDQDPGLALAYAGLSDAYYQLSTRWIPAEQAMPRARAAAEQALKLDPNLAQAHIALSRVQAYWQFDWEAAERSLDRALALKPGLASVREAYGLLLLFRGRTDSALTQLRQAQVLDPLSDAIAFEVVWPLFFGNRLPEAFEAYQQTAVALRTSLDASLAEIYSLQGEYPRAIQMLEAFRDSHPGMDARYHAVLARAYHAVGNGVGAQTILDTLLARSREGNFGNSYMLAILYAGIGKPDQALEWLERCDSVRNENIILIKVDPEFASIRSEPRFQAILKRIGLAN